MTVMKSLSLALCLLLAACAGTDLPPSSIARELAPSGTLRAALAANDPVSREVAGELARRLQVPLAETDFGGAYDVAFMLPEAARAAQLDFTGPYLVLDGRLRVIALRRGRPEAGGYLRDFVADLRASGFVAEAIERRSASARATTP